MAKLLMQCPNLECQAVWGIEEMSFQECDCCGYPYNEDSDEGYDDYDDNEYDPDDIQYLKNTFDPSKPYFDFLI